MFRDTKHTTRSRLESDAVKGALVDADEVGPRRGLAKGDEGGGAQLAQMTPVRAAAAASVLGAGRVHDRIVDDVLVQGGVGATGKRGNLEKVFHC